MSLVWGKLVHPLTGYSIPPPKGALLVTPPMQWGIYLDYPPPPPYRWIAPASGSANLDGQALPALRKLTIDGNIPPILSSHTRNPRPHRCGGRSVALFLPTVEAEEENGVEDALACDYGGQMAM